MLAYLDQQGQRQYSGLGLLAELGYVKSGSEEIFYASRIHGNAPAWVRAFIYDVEEPVWANPRGDRLRSAITSSRIATTSRFPVSPLIGGSCGALRRARRHAA